MARKILLADDSVTAQNMGRKILVDAGYEVVTVNNGSAALKRVNESKPDLIILDVYMPGYSGLEVCQRLKEAPGTTYIPVLLTVGKLEPFKPDEARRARADAHIVKPFEASELLSAVARLEDRMVPLAEDSPQAQKAAGGNGSAKKAVSAYTDDSPRPRSAQKKKEKEEAAVDPVDPATSFQDFRKAPAKPASQAPAAHAAAPEPKAPESDPDIPGDITPDELDALSAVAARLDNPYLAASIAAQAAAQSAAQSKKRTQVEEFSDETVSAAQFPQEQAPIDQRDEPFFAAAAPEERFNPTAQDAAPATGMAAALQEAGDKQKRSVKEFTVASPKFESEASAETAPLNTGIGTESSQTNFSAQTPFAPPIGYQAAAQAESAPPSEEELAAALRLLTPAAGHEAPSPTPGVTADHFFVQGSTHQSSSPRWIAETVALTPAEASLSLETEMFGARAAAPVAHVEPASVAGEEATAEAAKSAQEIENRPPDEVVVSSSSSYDCSTASALETIADSTPVTAAPALIAAAESAPPDTHQAEALQREYAASLMTEAELAAAVSAQLSKPNAIETSVSEPFAPPVPADRVEAPKAMAAAAAAEGAPPDPSAIASIVESMLADLRPKLVEEITRKLSGK